MFEALNRCLDRLESVAMVVFMSIATVLTTIQVVYRYGFSGSLFWAEEVVIYSIICMSFIGASMGVRHGTHISVDVLNSMATPAINRWLHLIAALIGIVFAGFMTYYGFVLYFNTLGRGQLTAALRLPMAWFYLPIGISGVLLVLRYVWVIREVWNKPPVSLSEELVAESDKLV
ncbi:TRAP transporter small permease [Vreelandella nigrificans]|uniref:TRAP transporter small permease protein n=1 Tax=Vreelandella nigrificans TaxID=2042704 RepID=A0A2A4HGX5_9GAMM|nr:TRAP transporter small permease [Halomonas nigrificans]PCF93637.1 TRAP transporter permease DctQ [Halomonas nigrificans]